MKITKREVNGWLILKLEGEININNYDVFNANFNRFLDTNQGKDFIINLESLTFSNSQGISCFINAHNAVSERGHKIYFSNLNDFFRELVRVINLDKVLNISKTENDILSKN